MNNFDLKQYLTENKLTTNSKLLNEERENEIEGIDMKTGIEINIENIEELFKKGLFDNVYLNRDLEVEGLDNVPKTLEAKVYIIDKDLHLDEKLTFHDVQIAYNSHDYDKEDPSSEINQYGEFFLYNSELFKDHYLVVTNLGNTYYQKK